MIYIFKESDMQHIFSFWVGQVGSFKQKTIELGLLISYKKKKKKKMDVYIIC